MKRQRLSETVFVALLRKLSGGFWSPGTVIPPVRELTKELRVSPLTVLAALRRAAGCRLLDVRQRQPTLVLPDADRRAAKMLKRFRARATAPRLAILLPEMFVPLKNHPDYEDLVKAVASRAAVQGVRVKVVKWPLLDQVGFVRTFVTQDYDVAFAIATGPEHLVSLDLLRRHSIPVLLFNRMSPMVRLPAVRFDEYGAAWRIGETLAALGHTNLCMMHSVTNHRRSYLLAEQHTRTKGWLDFLRHANLLGSCSLPIYYLPETMMTDMLDVPLRLKPRPTAIVFAGVQLAKVFLQDPRFSDLKVPENISLATFDSFKGRHEATWCPPLAEIAADLKRVAQCVVEAVGLMLADGATPPNIRVPMDIHVTDSIGPAPSICEALQ